MAALSVGVITEPRAKMLAGGRSLAAGSGPDSYTTTNSTDKLYQVKWQRAWCEMRDNVSEICYATTTRERHLSTTTIYSYHQAYVTVA